MTTLAALQLNLHALRAGACAPDFGLANVSLAADDVYPASLAPHAGQACSVVLCAALAESTVALASALALSRSRSFPAAEPLASAAGSSASATSAAALSSCATSLERKSAFLFSAAHSARPRGAYRLLPASSSAAVRSSSR
eukprot:CAMPEP_0119182690 /NCGR_PEP_ID=MMETSP1315-20130426/62534_1 /TAXON_ID=676789 /ORGANISM="Prasinoderma singularis, Strain RCC927" /LENGTH=140 /DNA_ID=CAMNT_0007177053 /DNA_START=13 /DNA_END=432 /DNA_ORIENTATION=-